LISSKLPSPGTSYGNVFLLVSAVTGAGVLLAVFLRPGSEPSGGGPRFE